MHYPEITGSDLLNIAQHTLTEMILPELGTEHRQLGRLIANAMRIVAREIVQRGALKAATDDVLSISQLSWPDAEGRSNPELLRSLVQALRDGHYDADTMLHTALWAESSIRTSATKPSALTRIERQLAGINTGTDG